MTCAGGEDLGIESGWEECPPVSEKGVSLILDSVLMSVTKSEKPLDYGAGSIAGSSARDRSSDHHDTGHKALCPVSGVAVRCSHLALRA